MTPPPARSHNGRITSSSVPTRRPRAPRLRGAERRQVVIDAAIPLLVEHGENVTVVQIAQAAGIAAGTMFRVFEDKQALLNACVQQVLDAVEIDAAIAEAATRDTIAERLDVIGTALRAYLHEVQPLVSALTGTRHQLTREFFGTTVESLMAEVAALLASASDADRLRHDPTVVARMYVALYIAEEGGLRAGRQVDLLPIADITDLLVSGAVASPEAAGARVE